jgi:ubiquitin carboxyl-terminal hydrolase 5/13
LTLQQDPNAPKIKEKNFAHCGECELNNNLWLCMICGHLGCGRKNWDGTGGNGHAVQHNEETKHPLVLKMGTITAEGKKKNYYFFIIFFLFNFIYFYFFFLFIYFFFFLFFFIFIYK